MGAIGGVVRQQILENHPHRCKLTRVRRARLLDLEKNDLGGAAARSGASGVAWTVNCAVE